MVFSRRFNMTERVGLYERGATLAASGHVPLLRDDSWLRRPSRPMWLLDRVIQTLACPPLVITL